MGTTMRLPAEALLAALLLGTAAPAQNVSYQPDPRWTPPARAVQRVNPLARKPAAVTGGRKLFLRECAACHGGDGGGIKNAADLDLPVVQNQTDGALFWKITSGNPGRGMPAWSRLPESQRWQLVLFLRTLGRRPG
jgi:mono/diheme cytochrome c family protein